MRLKELPLEVRLLIGDCVATVFNFNLLLAFPNVGTLICAWLILGFTCQQAVKVSKLSE